MKKQLLTLGVCLALSATSVLACGNAAFDKNVNSCAKTTVKTKPCDKNLRAGKKMKAIEAQMNKERELLYNALNLSEDQRTKARAIDAKSRLESKPLFDDLMDEKKELRELKADKANKMEVCKQKREVKKAKKELKKHMKATKKEFVSILDKDQKAKFNIIMKEKKAAMKAKKSKMKANRKEMRKNRP